MAINPMIALAGQPVDLAEAMFQGQQHANEMAMAPIQRAAMQQQANAQEQAAQQQLMQNQAIGANYALQTAQHLKTLPMEQRLPVAQMAYAKLKAMGIGDGVADENALTDEALDNDVNSLAGVVQGYQQQFASRSGAKPFDTVGGVTYTTENGKIFANVVGADESGNVAIKRAELVGSPTIAGGETPEQKRLRESETQFSLEQRKQLLQTQQDLARLQQSIDPKASIAGAEAGQTTAAKEREAKNFKVVETGAQAIESIPKLERIEKILEGGLSTGKIAEKKQELAAVFNIALPDQASQDYAQFESLMYQELIKSLNLATGTQTAADQAARVKESFNTGRSSAANLELVKAQKAKALKEAKQGREVFETDPSKYGAGYSQFYGARTSVQPKDETPKAETTPKTDKWFQQ
jgi:hypothetical protein